MPSVRMYSTHICPYCKRAEHLLKKKGVQMINKIFVDHNPVEMTKMIEITGRLPYPKFLLGISMWGGMMILLN